GGLLPERLRERWLVGQLDDGRDEAGRLREGSLRRRGDQLAGQRDRGPAGRLGAGGGEVDALRAEERRERPPARTDRECRRDRDLSAAEVLFERLARPRAVEQHRNLAGLEPGGQCVPVGGGGDAGRTVRLAEPLQRGDRLGAPEG